MIKIDRSRCIKCLKCVHDCPVAVLTPGSDGFPVLAAELEKCCINCQHCLAICPAGALNCHGAAPEDCPAAGRLPAAEDMQHLIRMRRSVRFYQDENLAPEVLAQIKNIMAWMPTGCNDHRLFFHLVEDKAGMDFFREGTNTMIRRLVKSGILRWFYPNIKRFLDAVDAGKDVVYRGAPHMIVCAAPKNSPCKEADPWIALSYLDLYLQSLGLGSCWCGFALHVFKWNRRLRKRLQLPRGYKVGAVLLFGKPAVTYVRPTAPSECRFSS